MAKESMKAREVKRAALIAKYAEKRAALKLEGNYEALQALPKNSCPTRIHNRCKLTGRPKGYMRQFGKLVIKISIKYCPEYPDQFKSIV